MAVVNVASPVRSAALSQRCDGTLTLAVDGVLERWFRAGPGAWLWLHRRWPRAAWPRKQG